MLFRRQRHNNKPKIDVTAVETGVGDPDGAVGCASVCGDLAGWPISTVDVDDG